MHTKLFELAVAGVLLLAGVSARTAGAQAAGSSECNATCLTNMADQYVAAMVKHDWSGLPLAPGYKYTENTAAIQLGDGLWVGASEAPTTFKIYAADPVSKQVGLYCVMKEFNKPIILALRLKVEEGKIAEIEHIVVRDIRPAGAPNLVTPRSGLVQTIPVSQRVSRDEMYRIADSYFDSIEQSNGDLAPYADDCVRHENGMQTTTNKTPSPTPLDAATAGPAANPSFAKLGALSCHDSMNTHILSYITKIRPRRLIIIDEERGLVFGFPMFVHRGNVRQIKVVGVPGVDTVPMNFGPIDLQAAEIFAIRNGKIHEIEAMGYLLPYNAKTGWE
ncbi:MAG: hypothetical protein P4L00_03255 [Candidatus Acidoferrales bacterium]|nr:hypothetical protein [Candidatus Acidoferrales bacterium]